MARRKTITREDILEAAFKLVASEGFGHFTARNVATKVGSSTQPIYLEFKNMDDLKDAVYEKIYHYLGDEVFPVRHTGDIIVDMCLNYIHFAKREKKLYFALYLDSAADGNRMEEFSKKYFAKKIQEDAYYRDFDDEKLNSLRLGSWITATGIASLMSAGIIHPSDEEIIQFLEDGNKAIEALDHPIQVN
ncbi:TetR/AcrR family transcriptional regulator [Enterococcus nangangensis]|uniref:TetR/AcrR family transcriptional regulator n=1 Tax=Enterococcus nangangensis TaxID=2559926 RepID=UPI0010FA000B|nr:TetR family transcriptional regulator [Enterococcus nangangensis]